MTVPYQVVVSSGQRLEASDRLAFLHFPKTAGTTIHTCFTAMFEEREVCPERTGRLGDWPPETLNLYRFFSSHSTVKDLRNIPRPLKVFTFLRDPVERCISLYEYWSSFRDDFIAEHNLHDCRLARAYDIEEFFSLRHIDQLHRLRNAYATGLAGDVYFSPSGNPWRSEQEILDAAMIQLEQLSFVGISEQLRLSMDRLCRQLDVPNFYTGQVQNVTKNNHLEMPDRHQETPDVPISNDIIELIRSVNSLDIQVYQQARSRLGLGSEDERTIQCISNGLLRQTFSRVWVQNTVGGFLIFGPYLRLFPGRYEAEFWVRAIGDNGERFTEPVGYVDVIAENASLTLGSAPLLGSSVSETETIVTIRFVVTRVITGVEFRGFLQPGVAMEICRDVALTQAVAGAEVSGWRSIRPAA